MKRSRTGPDTGGQDSANNGRADKRDLNSAQSEQCHGASCSHGADQSEDDDENVNVTDSIGATSVKSATLNMITQGRKGKIFKFLISCALKTSQNLDLVPVQYWIKIISGILLKIITSPIIITAFYRILFLLCRSG